MPHLVILIGLVICSLGLVFLAEYDKLPTAIIAYLAEHQYEVLSYMQDGDGWTLRIKRGMCVQDVHVILTAKGPQFFPHI